MIKKKIYSNNRTFLITILTIAVKIKKKMMKRKATRMTTKEKN
jgi:hypothetical protein